MPKSFLVKKPSRNKRKLEEERYDGKYLYCYSNTQAQRNLSLPKVSALSELRNTKLRRELGFYLRHRVSKRKFVEFCLIFFLTSLISVLGKVCGSLGQHDPLNRIKTVCLKSK